jgi:molybdate transport system ATP-binding protein
MSRINFDCRLRHASGFQLDASFTADDGVTALFGPSGAGKSTIFALVAGILRPQDGAIKLSDRVLVDTKAGVMLPPERRRIGTVFQDHLLFPHLSVRENLTFGRRVGAVPVDFGRLVEILELGPLLDRLPGTLSGGQRQRVALGRALLPGPELLLLDEPLTALDEGLKDRVLTYLERVLAEWNMPTLFVSHDQADVRRIAEQVIVLENGRVIDAGLTAATLDRALMSNAKRHSGAPDARTLPRPINLLRVDSVRSVDGHWEGRIGEQILHLPPATSAHAAGHVHVQFLPHDVILAAGPVDGLSVRNQLQGRVRELVALADRTFVAVDVGQFLWAEITTEAVLELKIEPGQVVACLIKTSAIKVVQ